MTKYISIFLLISIGAFQGKTQIQDIYALADGSVYLSNIIYDQDGDLFGYLYIFHQGSVSKEEIQMEYVFLDKNLNKVSSAKFNTLFYDRCEISFTRASKMGDKIVINKNYNFWKSGLERLSIRQSTYFYISLKSNTVSPEYIFKENQIKEFQHIPRSKIKKGIKKEGYSSYVLGIDYEEFNGFVVIEDAKYLHHITELKVFDEDNNFKWKFEYNQKGKLSRFDICQIQALTDSFLFVSLREIVGSLYFSHTTLVALNVHTGEQIFTWEIDKEKKTRRHNYSVQKRGEFIYIVGNYSDKNTYTKTYTAEKNLGLFKTKLDLNGKLISHDYYEWPSKLFDQKVNSHGQFTKDRFRLSTKALWVFNDGSISWLTEKLKAKVSSQRSFSEDFVLFHWDAAFKNPKISKIDKAKSKYRQTGQDYLFSDYIKDKSAVVFFHKNDVTKKKSKDKKWILGINKIENGVHTLEEIPMLAKDKFLIEPIPAKEGFVLLREYNKDEKYNQIRLERLNY